MFYLIGFYVSIVALVVVSLFFSVYLWLSHSHIREVEITIHESSSVSNVADQLRSKVHSSVPIELEEVEPELAGLIVEPRNHHNLIPVIENFKTVIPHATIYVIYGESNQKVLRNQYADDPNVILISLDIENLSIRQYNYIMTRPSLWASMKARHILVFQTDSVLFTKSNVKIQDYLQYDFVGAPWRNMWDHCWRHAFKFRSPGGVRRWATGNGGLSLRNRSVMQRICQEQPYLSVPYLAEDVYFANAVEKLSGVHLPTMEHAAKLFYETVLPDQLPFGCHKFLPTKFINHITQEEQDIINSYSSQKKFNKV